MCGGGGGGDDSIKYQRQQERERAQRIDKGKAQLERIFAGLEGKSYTNPTTKPQSYQQWYDSTQRNVRRHPFARRSNPENILNQYNSYVRNFERNSPLKTVATEGPPIWEQQTQAYLDYANPQLEDQYGDAQEQLGFALARQGVSSSSIAGDKWGDLSRDYKLQQQGVADKARGYGNKARADIADQKQAMLSMLNSTADPGATAAAARAQVSSLAATPSFNALGPLFQNVTDGLAAGYRGNSQYQSNQRVGDIVYGGDPDRGSGRTVR